MRMVLSNTMSNHLLLNQFIEYKARCFFNLFIEFILSMCNKCIQNTPMQNNQWLKWHNIVNSTIITSQWNKQESTTYHKCLWMSAQCALESIFHVRLEFMSRWHRYHRLFSHLKKVIKFRFWSEWFVKGLPHCLSYWDVSVKGRLWTWTRKLFPAHCHCVVEVGGDILFSATGTCYVAWHMVL